MRNHSPRPNRQAFTALLLVAALALSLSPASVAAATPADIGTARGWSDLRVADEAGQCDPDTGRLTGSHRRQPSYYENGYPDGVQDYLVGGYLLIGNFGLMDFEFCMEIDPVEDAAGVMWEGEGSGVISSTDGTALHRMSSLRLVPQRDWCECSREGWSATGWRIHGRYHEAADQDIGGIFHFADICSVGCEGGFGVWQMVRDTY